MKFANDIQMRSQTIPNFGMSIEHTITKAENRTAKNPW